MSQDVEMMVWLKFKLGIKELNLRLENGIWISKAGEHQGQGDTISSSLANLVLNLRGVKWV